MAIPFKKDPIESKQRLLFPTNIYDLLPEDHECRIYDAIFQELDTSSVEADYSVRGQNAYHPRRIVGILIYAYSQGIFSSRQIEKKCREDIGFMFISHMNRPNFRVLSDFRKKYSDFFKECFKQSVQLAIEIGLASLGHVSLDGSKFQADTSKHKAMSYAHLKAREKELVQEIEELIARAERCDNEENEEYQNKTGYEIPDDLKFKQKRLEKIRSAKESLEKREQELKPGKKIDDKKQISFADQEARIMGKKGHFEYAYNGQISVDEDNQIIVGEHVTQNANDKKELVPALEQVHETTGGYPEKASADNGYMSGDNLDLPENMKEIDLYVATGKEDKIDKRPLDETNRTIKKSDFTYNEVKDSFLCPGGQILELKSESKDGTKIYQGSDEVCAECRYSSRCCRSKNGSARTVRTDSKEPLRQEMINKMEKNSSREVYEKRKVIVEPVFGQIKNSGFRRFSLRGFKKVSGEFSLVCATHNFKKIVKAALKGLVRLESGKLATMAC